jgi:hypothetical protein
MLERSGDLEFVPRLRRLNIYLDIGKCKLRESLHLLPLIEVNPTSARRGVSR